MPTKLDLPGEHLLVEGYPPATSKGLPGVREREPQLEQAHEEGLTQEERPQELHLQAVLRVYSL